MSRARKSPKTGGKETPLLPAESAREMALFFVVCALCFLAALAALTAKATYGAAEGWTNEVEGEITVVLKDADRRAGNEALKIIRAVDGIDAARVLTGEEMRESLKSALNVAELPDAALPLPVMLAVQVRPGTLDPGPKIKRLLSEAGLTADVSNHADWAGDVRRALAALRWAALFAVALLSATALAVIAFATHAALLAQANIVNVLHLSGATDGFVARLFERRFWLLGLRAGAVGALAAVGGAALLALAIGSNPERSGLLPRISPDVFDLIILLATPIIAGVAARFAARLTVTRSLAVAA